MDFTVGDWMNDLIVFIDPNKLVKEALALMRRRYISSLIVNKTIDNDYGIITSTDICDKIIAQDRNPARITVKEIMNTPLLTVERSVGIRECAIMMSKYKIHHLPVTNGEGNLVGMISATDFLVVAEAKGQKPGEQIV